MHKVEVKETKGCTKTLDIEVSRERFDDEVKTSLQTIKRDVQIPGFRKGRAPEAMLMRRFGASIQQEALKDMVPKVLQEVFDAEGFKPVGDPDVLDIDLQDSGPVTFTISIEEVPDIDVAPFEGIAVTKEIREIADEDADYEIERMRRMRATQDDVDREAQANDILVINLQKLDESGVPIVGEKIENHVIMLDGQSTPSPDFDAQVVGMNKGDKKDVSFTYDDSIDKPDLVGTTERYSVEVLRVLKNNVPELNDEFVKELGDFADVDDFRAQTLARLKKMSDAASDRTLHADLVNEFLKVAPFEVPNSMVERVTVSEVERAKRQGGQEFDEQAFRERMRPDAVRMVQTWLIVDAIKEKQNVEVTSEEVTARIEEIAATNDMNPKELKRRLIKEGQLNGLKDDIAQEKAYEWMLSVAKVDETTVKPSEESKIVKP